MLKEYLQCTIIYIRMLIISSFSLDSQDDEYKRFICVYPEKLFKLYCFVYIDWLFFIQSF